MVDTSSAPGLLASKLVMLFQADGFLSAFLPDVETAEGKMKHHTSLVRLEVVSARSDRLEQLNGVKHE